MVSEESWMRGTPYRKVGEEEATEVSEVAQDVMEITGTSGRWKYEEPIKRALEKYFRTGEKTTFKEMSEKGKRSKKKLEEVR